MMTRSTCFAMACVCAFAMVAAAAHHPISTVALGLTSIYWLRAARGLARICDEDLSQPRSHVRLLPIDEREP